jgi:hypothetical protein
MRAFFVFNFCACVVAALLLRCCMLTTNLARASQIEQSEQSRNDFANSNFAELVTNRETE